MATDTATLFSRVLQGDDGAAGAPGGPNSSADASAASGALGGFLVCLDVPPMTEFGVDYEVFRTGPKFQGVKFLPLGVHLVVFRAKEQEHGIRQGFFLRVERHAQVLVREWSAEKEELAPPRPGLNLEALEQAVLSFQLDDRLGAYPKQHAKLWHRLSSAISESVLRRCGLELGALILPGDSDALSADADADAGEVVPFFPDLPRTAKFTNLRRKRADLSGAQRTAYHFDRSAMLDELLTDEFGGDWRELLGELQLAFVLFLQLSSMAALEQWKQFVALLCSCERALEAQPALMVAFLKAFRVQMEQIPADFFEDELTSGNFLRPCLASLLELVDAAVPDPVRRQGLRVRDLLQRRFGWAADDALDEFAPVLVPLHELSLGDASVLTETPTETETPAETAPIPTSSTMEEEDANARIAAAFLASRPMS